MFSKRTSHVSVLYLCNVLCMYIMFYVCMFYTCMCFHMHYVLICNANF